MQKKRSFRMVLNEIQFKVQTNETIEHESFKLDISMIFSSLLIFFFFYVVIKHFRRKGFSHSDFIESDTK
jgi:hypothetical protein